MEQKSHEQKRQLQKWWDESRGNFIATLLACAAVPLLAMLWTPIQEHLEPVSQFFTSTIPVTVGYLIALFVLVFLAFLTGLRWQVRFRVSSEEEIVRDMREISEELKTGASSVAHASSDIEKKMLHLQNNVLRLENLQRMEAIEIMNGRERLFERMQEFTLGSQSVCTQMFSPRPHRGTAFEKYMRETHDYVRRTPGMNFRRIVTLGDDTKILWIFRVVTEMIGAPGFSMAYVPINQAETMPLCCHLVKKHGVRYTLIFHAVPDAGNVDGFLSKNPAVYDLALRYYDVIWAKFDKLIESGAVNRAVVMKIAELRKLEESMEFKTLIEKLDRWEASQENSGGLSSWFKK